MDTKSLFDFTIAYFEQTRPVAESELIYHSPYELLVAVILSAQCTDKRVNSVTPAFFERFPTPGHLAASSVEEVYQIIKSISYPHNKSKHLVGMAQKLSTDFNGVVPSDTDLLQQLPGVGRKTAHVIASVIFHIPKMAVDTHVFRVANRIGLTNHAKTPLETEKQLIRYIPEEKITIAHHWFILHGRYICTARKPKCTDCGLTSVCKYFKEKERKEPKSSAI